LSRLRHSGGQKRKGGTGVIIRGKKGKGKNSRGKKNKKKKDLKKKIAIERRIQ